MVSIYGAQCDMDRSHKYLMLWLPYYTIGLHISTLYQVVVAVFRIGSTRKFLA
jgi:hypothetical protein